jgi:hypothetical protein
MPYRDSFQAHDFFLKILAPEIDPSEKYMGMEIFDFM